MLITSFQKVGFFFLNVISGHRIAVKPISNSSPLQWDAGGGIGQLFTYLLLSKSCVSSTPIAQGSGYSHKGGRRVLPIWCTRSAEGPCPHWDKGTFKTMHRDFRKQNTVYYQKAYSQECSTPFSHAETLFKHCGGQQHPGPSWALWGNERRVPAENSFWDLVGFPLGLMFTGHEVTTGSSF